ncbi:MAG: TIGR00341 family protein [Candidatus Heimdallarchaeota archaeon]|nr:TIGR00341 family protein [Candidatus Heimdallarchaeota archaeon]MCK5047824.1 TIGR00341 family protein [Candidatus Heimdallarchaeota archaeon]
MKEIRVIVPEKQASLVHELFEHYNINYFSVNSSQETGEIMIISSMDDSYSNFILGELKARGIGSTYGRIIISSATLEIDSSEDKKTIPSSRAGNLEEIVAGLRGGAEISVNFVALTFLAACLASFGLRHDDSITIIGSMIVAPLLPSIALTSLSPFIPGEKLFRKAFLTELVGILICIVIGGFLGVYFSTVGSDRLDAASLPAAMESRSVVELGTIALALFSGLAGGVILAQGKADSSIVGVAIAAALCPPATNIGLLLSINAYSEAMGASGLLLVNIFAINFSCTLIFWLFKVAETSGISARKTRETINRIRFVLFLAAIILLILIILVSINPGSLNINF